MLGSVFLIAADMVPDIQRIQPGDTVKLLAMDNSDNAVISGDGRTQEHTAEINRLDDAADQVIRATVLAIHRTFITPVDRF